MYNDATRTTRNASRRNDVTMNDSTIINDTHALLHMIDCAIVQSTLCNERDARRALCDVRNDIARAYDVTCDVTQCDVAFAIHYESNIDERDDNDAITLLFRLIDRAIAFALTCDMRDERDMLINVRDDVARMYE